MIKLFNPSFDSEEEESTQFLKAVRVAKEIFNEEVLFANGKVIANKKVNDIHFEYHLHIFHFIPVFCK